MRMEVRPELKMQSVHKYFNSDLMLNPCYGKLIKQFARNNTLWGVEWRWAVVTEEERGNVTSWETACFLMQKAKSTEISGGRELTQVIRYAYNLAMSVQFYERN